MSMNAPSSRASSPWCLRFLSGAVRGRTIALKPGSNVLGAAGECDVMLPGSDVLPQHLVFTVGELAVSVQKVGAATAQLNGEDMQQSRRSVVAGDVISVGQIDFQIDRNQAAIEAEDKMLGWAESMLPDSAAGDAAEPPPPPRRAARGWGASLLVLALAGLLGLVFWQSQQAANPRAATIDMAEVQKLLAGFPEVEAVAAPAGQVILRGYVESMERQVALKQSMERFGPKVSISVMTAEEMVERARRFVSDPGVTIAYAGRGRLVVSGAVEDDGVRLQIRRLSEDLHPTVLVSDKVQYRPKPVREEPVDTRTQWAAWQDVLPARMVGITEDGNGLRHIQLANGSRYYEGSVLPSGAELKRIEADGLVLSGGPETPKKANKK